MYGFPETVYVVPSNACNFRCRACPKSVYSTDNRMLDKQVYERVRMRLLPHARKVVLQGLGEPMLSPLFMPLLRDVRDLGLCVEFTTNASLIDETDAAEILACPAQMTISIDGSCAATHEDSRPGARFTQLLQVLSFVKHHIEADRAHPRFRLCVNTVITTRNLDEIEAIIDLCADHHASHLVLMVPAMGARSDAFAHDAIGNHEKLFESRIPTIRSHAQQRGIVLTLPPYLESRLVETPVTASSSLPLFPQKCLDPWRAVFVDVDGWVRPCCRGLNISMGNLIGQDFWDIWNGRHYFRLRETVNSDAPPEFCRNCSLAWGITGGDPNHEAKLAQRGICLAPPPAVGLTWDFESQKLVES